MTDHLKQAQEATERIYRSVAAAKFEIVDFLTPGADHSGLIAEARKILCDDLPEDIESYARGDGKLPAGRSGNAKTELEALLQSVLHQACKDLGVSASGLTLRIVA